MDTELFVVEVNPGAHPVVLSLTWNRYDGVFVPQSLGSNTGVSEPWDIYRADGRTSFSFNKVASVTLNGHYAGGNPDGSLGPTHFQTNQTVQDGSWYAYRVAQPGGRPSTTYRIRTVGTSRDEPTSSAEVAPTWIAPSSRWRFQTLDGSHSYRFEANPNQESSTVEQRVLRYDFSIDTGLSATREGRTPVQYSFSGTIHTDAQHKAFQQWLAKDQRIFVITDLGQVHTVRLTQYKPSLSAPGQGRSFTRRTYTMSGLLYDAIPGAAAKYVPPSR